VPAHLRIEYTTKDSRLGNASLMPYASAILGSSTTSCDAIGLVDSGASVNVLPYQIGRELGLDWASQRTAMRLSGNLADGDARAVKLSVAIATLRPIDLVFAWSSRDDVPMIFGQTNFFIAFDVCFFRSLGFFTVSIHADG